MPEHEPATTTDDRPAVPRGDLPDPSRRRPEIVRRLRSRGLSDHTIRTLLPGWRDLLGRAERDLSRGPRVR